MNFVALVVHGLSALSVHAEVAGVRLLVASLLAAALTAILVVLVVAVRLFSDIAVPGWASAVTVGLIVLLAQWVGLALSFVFIILGARSAAGFVPARDYTMYVHERRLLFTPPHTAA
jgi:hypothetical protein